jgi:hypothetical protein
MRTLLFFGALFIGLVAGARAQVVLTRSGDSVHIEMAGKPFSDFYFGTDAPKPYLHPLRSASGKIVTRRFPMEKVEGETTTDVHHRSVWLSYELVNGFDFWQNEASENNKLAGKIVAVRVDDLKSGAHEGSLRGVFRWLSPAGEAMLEETRHMAFGERPGLRIVDLDVSLKALVDTTFGDTKDGAYSVRLAEPLIEKNGGVITNSEGGRGMKETWGKPASWVDYSGELQGEKLGVAMFQHPSSFRYPARWHVRDYGLLAVNPFGSKGFDKDAADATFVLKKGDAIRLRYRIVVHGALGAGELAGLYREFAREP